ncbi:MAG TPA: carboxypeptidase regulatory-like domain-containing protein, partial [Blastocatellia bacterium]|nr:carboxypeptidase regulatory-like domain-containing protein [Blastocatellia bacterium]
MKLQTRLVLIALAIIVNSIQIFAQASGSTAVLRGQVTDPAGAVVPNARVTLADTGKGATRAATTDGEGNYVFLGILPGIYNVQGEAKGFSPTTIRVELTVGQQANVTIRLATGSVQEKVEIAAGSEVIEVSRTQQSSVVEAGQIQNLPISRRNYLDYALLTPGVSDSDNIADSSDFRLAQTPQSGLSFGGNNGRGNYIAVDGGATLSGSGGPIYVASQEAVQEFQVLRNSFNAEFGTVTGGVINTVTRSGANSLHGSGFGLFRNQRFDSRNVFDFNPAGKSPFNRQQFGGSLGGPIKRDQTFYFAAAESFHQQETAFVNLLRSPAIFQPTAGQTSLLDYLQSQPATAADSDRLRAMLTTTNFPRTVKLLTDSTG